MVLCSRFTSRIAELMNVLKELNQGKYVRTMVSQHEKGLCGLDSVENATMLVVLNKKTYIVDNGKKLFSVLDYLFTKPTTHPDKKKNIAAVCYQRGCV